jgi:hypothetical protein
MCQRTIVACFGPTTQKPIDPKLLRSITLKHARCARGARAAYFVQMAAILSWPLVVYPLTNSNR